MAECLLNKYFLVLVFFLIQLEFVMQSCLSYYIFYVKSNIAYIRGKIWASNNFSCYNPLLVCLILTNKGSTNNMIIFIFILYNIVVFTNKLVIRLNQYSKNDFSILLIVNMSLYFYTYIFTFISSLISLLFLLELLTVLYYFYFLNNHNNTKLTILQYKNSLLLFLWNSFLTTTFFSLLMLYCLLKWGSTGLYELNLYNNSLVFIILLLISISWKLGLPLFHFFKIELYLYLLSESIFLFSVTTLFINIFFFFFILSQPFIYTIFASASPLILSFIVSFILTLINLNISNFFYFLSYSTLITLTTVLALFLS